MFFKRWSDVVQFEKEEKKKDESLEYSKIQYIHEIFKHYRSSASVFSVTIIGLDSGILVTIWWKLIETIKDKGINILWPYILIGLPVIVSMVTAVFIQYLIFRGYHHEANSIRGDINQPTREKYWENAQKKFRLADKLTFYTLFLFLIGFIAVILSLIYTLL